MALKDKIKWEKKYQEKPNLLTQREPSEKLVSIINKIQGRKALDVACGSGKHSIYLAKNDFKVEAIDIAQEALDNLNKKAFPNITTTCLDLDDFTPTKQYDIIIKTNFLDRTLIPKLKNALTVNGVLFIETYMEDEHNEKKDSNPNYLLKKEELKTFSDTNYEIILYEEFDNETYEMYRMRKQAIAIKRMK